MPKRKKVLQPDGKTATEKSITIQDSEGHWRNIPSMFGGIKVSQREAISIMEKNNWTDPETGRETQKFQTLKGAVRAAQERSDMLGEHIEEEERMTGPQQKRKNQKLKNIFVE